MSTADHAGRPVRPSAPSGRPARGDGGSLRRLAGDGGRDTTAEDRGMKREAGGDSDRAGEPTRPVPAARENGAPGAPRTAAVPAQRPQQSPGAPRPTGGAPVRQGAPARPGAPRRTGARRVRLTVSRIDPWSAMKMSFLLSVALGIALVVMTVVLWTVLDAMGVFDQVNGVIGQVVESDGQQFDILDFVGFTRVVSLSIVIGVVDVILFTAIATLSAFLYNVSSALVGGVNLTLTDD